MATIESLLEQYQAADTKLTEHESAIVEAKAERSRIAKQIHDEHGAGPYTLNGKEQVATQMKGTFFLRVPFQPGRKKTETATP
jgi:hypothetical protein